MGIVNFLMHVFSFHPVKPITTAECAVLTNDKKIHNIVEMFRTRGITKNREFFNKKMTLVGTMSNNLGLIIE